MLKIGLYGQVSIFPLQRKSLQNTGTDQLCTQLCTSAKCLKALHEKQMWSLEKICGNNKEINKRIRLQEYSSTNFVGQLKTAILVYSEMAEKKQTWTLSVAKENCSIIWYTVLIVEREIKLTTFTLKKISIQNLQPR
ncbi:hypothetical protein GHT06_020907 [Daphnia sinensis]|uniref:Uncharacterized protein n=1 Tax=Daphnia sinensis TaxID=1820382 RepID=A0AAD5PS30_9CRUS|nr:hypothetical protein GHT06_020907 [Daphnia sinensis]